MLLQFRNNLTLSDLDNIDIGLYLEVIKFMFTFKSNEETLAKVHNITPQLFFSNVILSIN